MLVENRDSVLKAIEQFDVLGRDDFLAKHGFGRAREFFLFHKGRFYDSKAIVGVARGLGESGSSTLPASEFSGGEATVQNTLQGLGFTVVRTRLPDVVAAGEPSAVILTWNPARWEWTERATVEAQVGAGKLARVQWSSGNTRSLPVGTRAFLLRQGEAPRGIIASGWTVAPPFEAPHWNAELASKGEKANYVELEFDALLPVGVEPVDPRSDSGPLSRVNWAMPASGTRILGESYIATEMLWAERASMQAEGSPWTREELTASVAAYLDMLQRGRRGEKVVKTEYYRELAKRFRRTEKSFEFRMQNISYVLSLTGRKWIKGLMPARNVGVNTAAEIESILAELEQRVPDPNVAFEARVAAVVVKGTKDKPAGTKTPKKSSGTTTVYDRDPEVKAWVLREAKGICECCKRDAPFLSSLGPFLEVHHVRQLADGGPDIVENAVAICPNCHRELHHGVSAQELVEKLYATVERLNME